MPGSQLVTLTVIALGLAVAAGLARLVYLVVRDTRRRAGRWAINLEPPSSPHSPPPRVTDHPPRRARPGPAGRGRWGGWAPPEVGLGAGKVGGAPRQATFLREGKCMPDQPARDLFPLPRRDFLRRSGLGLGSLGLAG